MCIRDSQNADRQMNEEKKNAAYQIRQVRDQAVKEIAEMQGALAVSYTHLDVYKRQTDSRNGQYRRSKGKDTVMNLQLNFLHLALKLVVNIDGDLHFLKQIVCLLYTSRCV